MIQVDLNRIREALPARAKVTIGLKGKPGTPYIECIVRWPGLPHEGENSFEEVKNWQREIIGAENISEFYTEETGSHWFIFLKRQPIEFLNLSDEDVNNWTGMQIVKDGKLNKPAELI